MMLHRWNYHVEVSEARGLPTRPASTPPITRPTRSPMPPPLSSLTQLPTANPSISDNVTLGEGEIEDHGGDELPPAYVEIEESPPAYRKKEKVKMTKKLSGYVREKIWQVIFDVLSNLLVSIESIKFNFLIL